MQPGQETQGCGVNGWEGAGKEEFQTEKSNFHFDAPGKSLINAVEQENSCLNTGSRDELQATADWVKDDPINEAWGSASSSAAPGTLCSQGTNLNSSCFYIGPTIIFSSTYSKCVALEH